MFCNPELNCLHIINDKIMPSEILKEYSSNFNNKCSICNSDSVNLSLCLNCKKLFCSNNHLLLHIIESKDNLSISLEDLSVYCSKCNKYISSNILNNHIQYIFENKYSVPNYSIYSKEEIMKIKYKNFIELFKNNKFENIVFCVGAGISTSAGIPDFRSNTGLFKQLQIKYNLSTPEEFFYKKTFLERPQLFYEFCKNFDLSMIKPTLTHKFMNYMIKKKNKVKYIFTQNIDGLETKAKIPRDKIIYSHGTFTEGHCPQCKIQIDINEINQCIQQINDSNNIPIKLCPNCGGPCKPNVVFYGESLPDDFFEKANEIFDSELCIIMGTSLQVHPFASIPKIINSKAWKIAINLTQIGKFGYDLLTVNSLFLKGKTDDVIMQIINDCEWKDDFLNFLKSEYD